MLKASERGFTPLVHCPVYFCLWYLTLAHCTLERWKSLGAFSLSCREDQLRGSCNAPLSTQQRARHSLLGDASSLAPVLRLYEIRQVVFLHAPLCSEPMMQSECRERNPHLLTPGKYLDGSWTTPAPARMACAPPERP